MLTSLPPIFGLSQGFIRGLVAIALVFLVISSALNVYIANARRRRDADSQ
jgi:hypothetical protein